MATYTVSGGHAGYSDPDAGQVRLTDRFSEEFGTEADAVARAREILSGIRPGGQVLVEDVTEDAVFGRVIGCAGRYPEGPWETSGRAWVTTPFPGA